MLGPLGCQAVPGGDAAQPPADPGHGILPGPARVKPARREPGDGLQPDRLRAQSWRQRLAPVGVGGQAHDLAGPQGHPPVTVRAQVQPVRAPLTRIAENPHRPEVHQAAIAAVSDHAQVHVVDGHLAADQPDQRERARVEPGKHQYLAAGRAQLRDCRVERLRERIGIRPGPEQIVAAGRDADQVGRHGHGPGHLLRGDLSQQPAPHREVGVAQTRVVSGETFGEPVRPAAVARVGVGGLVRVRIPDALGKAVPQRDKSSDIRQRVPHQPTCSAVFPASWRPLSCLPVQQPLSCSPVWRPFVSPVPRQPYR